MSRTADTDNIIKWVGVFADEQYYETTDKKNFPYSVTIRFPVVEVAKREFLFAHSDWHAANQKWLFARKCLYKCSTGYSADGYVDRVYYFRTKGEAMLFGLRCPRKV